MKITPHYQYVGCSLDLSPEEAEQLSRICLHYNRSVKAHDPRLTLSVAVMQGLDHADKRPFEDED